MTVQDIRAFNRFYTNVIGALDYGRHLYAPYTLTESRVLYELAHSPRTDAADLRTASVDDEPVTGCEIVSVEAVLVSSHVGQSRAGRTSGSRGRRGGRS